MKTGWYQDKYCKMLIDHMKKGHSFESFAGVDGVWVARSTLYQWAKDQPDFAIAREVGQAMRIQNQEAQLLLMTRGIALKDDKGNLTFDPKHGKPQIIQWFLARQNPDIYAEKKQIDLRSSDGSMSPKQDAVDLSKLSDSALEEYALLQEKIEELLKTPKPDETK